MSLVRTRGYRIVRAHRIGQDLVSRMTRGSSPQRNGNIRSMCLVFGEGTKEDKKHVEQNNLRLFDSNTYLEANFDRVLRDPKASDLWNELSPSIDIRKHNSLIVLLERQPLDLLANFPLLEEYRLDNEQFNNRKEQWGLIERTADLLTKQLDKTFHEEIVVSIMGFTHGAMIDMLNLSREGQVEKLKITKEGTFTNIVNLTQMEIESPEFLMNTLLYAKHFGNLYEQSSGQQIEAELYQLSICRLSLDGLSIQSIVGKCSFVRLTNEANSLKNSLQNCLRMIGKEESFMPTRTCKLTHSLEDCLTSKTAITLLTEVNGSDNVKSQMDSVAFHSSLQGRTLLRKNYYGDEDIVRKITNMSGMEQECESSSKMAPELRAAKAHSQKLPSLQGKINPALLSDTASSCQRRISLAEERLRTNHEPTSVKRIRDLSAGDKNQLIRQLYKFV